MTPFELDATGLMVWGLVAHLVADWPLQNAWMAAHKAERRLRRAPCLFWGGTARQPHGASFSGPGGRCTACSEDGTVPDERWWDRHPAAYVHAGIHGILLAFVFGWIAAPLALAHLLIDTRVPVAWWSRLVRQTQPEAKRIRLIASRETATLYDVGTEVRFWTDQVFHVATIAAAALIMGALA